MKRPSLSFASDHADKVIINGKIWTANPDQPWATALAIDGKDIVYVGDDEGAAIIGKPLCK